MEFTRSLDAWCSPLLDADLPVLATTALALEDLRANEDLVDVHRLAGVVGSDPLMALQLFRHVSKARPASSTSDAETVTAALLLLGIGPFFRAFGPRTSIEHLLGNDTEARTGFFDVSMRATRAATFALAFAVHKRDPDATIIHDAALLHEFVEMLLWMREPRAMVEIKRRQAADRQLRSAIVQAEVLGVSISEIKQQLITEWKLPELLTQMNSVRALHHPGIRIVDLAIRLARHSANGWADSAIPDDVNDAALLLNLGQSAVLKLIREIDQE